MKTIQKLCLATILFPLLTVPALASVTVNSPANGAQVTSPFELSALALSCSSQAVSSMGYSLDSSSDNTIVMGTSINAQVPAASGEHTLHVKAWGDKGDVCDTDVAISVATSAASTAGGISVSSPGSNAQVPTPFTLSASAATCSSQPVVAMGYSLDSSSDTVTTNGASLNSKVSAAAGAHTIHVKSWGNKGAGCTVAVPVTVSGTSTPPPSGSDGITVSSPTKGAVVGTTFSLVADAQTCSSQSVAAMGFSIDSGATTAVDKTAIGANITTSAGAHTLHVKSWGNGGAGCDTDVNFTAQGGSTPPVTGGITITSPANGADVSTDFTLAATAGSCSSQPVNAMGYSLDGSSKTATFNGTSFSASVAVSAGAHTVLVKSWGDKGSECSAEVSITAAGGSGTPAPSIVPSNAISASSLQVLDNWKMQHDTNAPGSTSGKTWLVKSPSISGNAREMVTQYKNSGNQRFDVSFDDDTTSTHFFYDAYVYLNGTADILANLELDMNQTMPNGQTAIFGFQCDGYAGTWDYTANAGSPKKPVDRWLHSHAHCNPRSWSRNTWHHVQVYYSRNDSGDITYHSVWLDGDEQGINATVPSAFALGWGHSLVTNVQVDGIGKGGTIDVFIDKLTVYRW
jgi:hypothetical protein